MNVHVSVPGQGYENGLIASLDSRGKPFRLNKGSSRRSQECIPSNILLEEVLYQGCITTVNKSALVMDDVWHSKQACALLAQLEPFDYVRETVGIHTHASKHVRLVSAMSELGQSKSKSDVANGAAFELILNPSAELITVVRQFLESFYLKVLDDADVSSRVALTTHELLENAAKYSADGQVRLYVQVDTQQGTALVRTTNRAAPAQIERVRACFDEIAGAADVSQYYAAMLRRSAHRTSGWGGIGLARIWAESDMSIHLVVTGDEVEIHANGPLHTKR